MTTSTEDELRAELAALRQELEWTRAIAGVGSDGRVGFPAPQMARSAFLEIQGLVKYLPVDGIGVNDVVARVRWLREQFWVLNPHDRSCYFKDGNWRCFSPCTVSKQSIDNLKWT